MSLRMILALLVISAFGVSARAQSVLVCKLQADQAIVKQDVSGAVSTEIVKRQPETLIFANFDTAKPVLKFGSVEIQLELLHSDGDTFWLKGFTPDVFGNGIVIWMVDRKSLVVIRSESFRPVQLPSQNSLGN